MEIETVIKNLTTNKRPGPDSLPGEFYWKFREELALVLLKIFHEIAEEGKLPNSFYETTVTLKSNPNMVHKKKTTGQYHWWT